MPHLGSSGILFRRNPRPGYDVNIAYISDARAAATPIRADNCNFLCQSNYDHLLSLGDISYAQMPTPHSFTTSTPRADRGMISRLQAQIIILTSMIFSKSPFQMLTICTISPPPPLSTMEKFLDLGALLTAISSRKVQG